MVNIHKEKYYGYRLKDIKTSREELEYLYDERNCPIVHFDPMFSRFLAVGVIVASFEITRISNGRVLSEAELIEAGAYGHPYDKSELPQSTAETRLAENIEKYCIQLKPGVRPQYFWRQVNY